MRFDQALARANALSTTDPRFVYVFQNNAWTMLVTGEGFWSEFEVTEPGMPAHPFMGDIKTIAAASRGCRPDAWQVELVGDAPLKLHGSNGVPVQSITPVHPEFAWRPMDGTAGWALSTQELRTILAVAQRADERDQIRPGLQCVRFHKDYVEAGDEAQFCRASLGHSQPYTLLVRAAALAKLKVLTTTTGAVRFSSWGLVIESHGERRTIRAVEAWYPPMDEYFAFDYGKDHPSGVLSFQADAKALAQALKPFSKKEHRRWLRLHTEGAHLNVEGLTTGLSSYCELGGPVAGGVGELDIVVHGDRFSTAVKAWPDAVVNFRRQPGWSRGPLRLATPAGFVEYLFPLEEQA